MTLALLACATAALALLCLGASGPLYRIGVLSLPDAFTLLRWSAYAGLAAMAVGLVAGIFAYRRRANVRTFLAALACLGGLAAFGIPFEWQRAARRVPPIHDISTDLDNPPTFDAVVPLRADAPNSLDRPPTLADQQRQGYSGLAPIALSMLPDVAFDRALAAAQDAGWRIVMADKAAGRIEATDTTRWFGFQDDIVVRLRPIEVSDSDRWFGLQDRVVAPSVVGTRVDVRSVSRVGRSDVGTNARRIRQYLERIQSDIGD